jgi:hypothetical protein
MSRGNGRDINRQVALFPSFSTLSRVVLRVPPWLVVQSCFSIFLPELWCQGSLDFIIFIRNRVSRDRVVLNALSFVTMFLGGSYHDRYNPHMWGVSHGQLIVFITLVCSQKEGRQKSSSSRGLRTSMDDLMIKMMMMTIFYRGTGTKCTENQIVTRNKDDNDDDYNTESRQWHPTNNSSSSSSGNNNNNNNTNNTDATDVCNHG